MESTLGKNAVKIIEIATKEWEYYINLISQWQVLRELTPVLKEILLWVKYYLASLCYRELIHERKSRHVVLF